MIADLPTVNDKLAWDKEVQRMNMRVRNCTAPHVIAVHGDWGSGKTSFMRQMQFALGGAMPEDSSVDLNDLPAAKPAEESKIVTVWFDAWRYQNEPIPVIALLGELRRQLSTAALVREKFKKIGEIACFTVLDSLGSIGKSIGFECMPDIDKIESRGAKWEKDNFSEPIQVDSIRERLLKTISTLLPDDGGRLVIFIDDLDRCSSRAAIRLLEGLKIYFSIPNCVFVLGINERILIDAIREEIAAPIGTSNQELSLRASHYLEKICTDIFRLPAPRSSVGLLAHWIEDLDQRHSLTSAVGATRCLPPNPRRLKALANQWVRFAACKDFPTDVKERQNWAVQVLIAAYLHQFHRDLWERWHFNPDFWDEIRAWCIRHDDGGGTDWSNGLKMIYKSQEEGVGLCLFPNPGDIENFWIGELVCNYQDHLSSVDFKPFVMTPEV